ncbi:hypothetical protein GH714_006519 [Hevea brasiliensis]|uniref:Disease resistance R13L4/SHOC-2-like LRR domain-containing protein n=1 Tax=Hevea brasiliensis TaxID=3981 RepID=A0A6A6N7D8_HEVBR|nr:hypothetical protein GH714_006519 [Hevea brasiliensis]
MACINHKIRDISARRDEAIPRSMSGSNNDQSLYQQGKPLPRDADQLDMVSFDEDVDAVMAQLLKDDPPASLFQLPKLPKAVGQLTRLRYLGLGSTYLEMLPVFINKLLNLQTLDLKRTCINTLPSSIWKMQKLRHLFLDESFRNTFVPRQEDSSLVDLQTLWGAFIDEDSPVRNGLDASLNIKKWGLKCKISVPSQNAAMSSQLVDVANWIVKLEHLQSLRLKSFDKSGQPWDLHLQSMVEHVDLSNVYLVGKLKNQHLASALPRSLIELTFSASGLVEDQCKRWPSYPTLESLGCCPDLSQERICFAVLEDFQSLKSSNSGS